MAESIISSDSEEEVFAGFDIEEVSRLQENRARHVWEEVFGNSDSEEEFLGFEPQEIPTNSDDEFFFNDSADEVEVETRDENNEMSVNWSSNLEEINVEEFVEMHGPTNNLGANATAKDFFDLFIDNSYLDDIVQKTIVFARFNGDREFSTTRQEISAFFGLNILIGIHQLPTVSMYWDSDIFIGVEGFKKTMPRHRFVELSKYLHLVDPNDEDPSDLLAKVRPLVDRLQEKFRDAYIPRKNIAVDEGLVKFNGRLSFKQYMPMKPDKFGIKVWLLADADTYFIPRFQIYLGKNRHNSELFQQKGLTFYVVWSLGEPYLDSGRHFFFDNFFTSVDLMKSLIDRKTYACGTCRTNRKNFPEDLKKLKLVQGEVRTHQDGNLVATVWRDKREVSLFSTNVSPQPEIHAEDQQEGRKVKRVVPNDMRKKPEVIGVYNLGMNGVDVNDQYRSYYPTGTPSKKWWKYLLWFFVNLSVVNAYILEKIAGTKKRRQLHFRLELAKQLIAGFNGYKRSSDSGKRAVRSVNVERLGQGHHLLKSKERKKACAMCSKVGRKRAEGRTCETTFVCEQCGVPLCRQIHGDMSCFDEWHSGNL